MRQKSDLGAFQKKKKSAGNLQTLASQFKQIAKIVQYMVVTQQCPRGLKIKTRIVKIEITFICYQCSLFPVESIVALRHFYDMQVTRGLLYQCVRKNTAKLDWEELQIEFSQYDLHLLCKIQQNSPSSLLTELTCFFVTLLLRHLINDRGQ